VAFSQLELRTLRLHLAGESHLVAILYEALANNCVRIQVRSEGARRREVVLPVSALQPVGFGEAEGLLAFSRRSFLGHRLLLEYFAFPEKFHFFDLAGFDEVARAGFGGEAEVLLFIGRFGRADHRQILEAGLTTETFQLSSTPIVNLFPHTSEPIQVTGHHLDYLLVPDARHRLSTEVYSVDEVRLVREDASEPVPLRPLYSLRHEPDSDDVWPLWHATRRPSGWRFDEGTDVYLSFANLDAQLSGAAGDVVTARLTCFNGDLPGRLAFGNPEGDFELPAGGPFKRVIALFKPTKVIRPPLGKPQLWRLISLLSLNYLSLVEEGTAALQELLRLHNLAESAAGEKNVQALVGVSSAPAHTRVESQHGLHFARGRHVVLTFDEEGFAGGGFFLLASVLDQFLAQYVSMNSFSRTEVRTTQRAEPVRIWPARAGRKTLL
jgi:type VI secretion system protein ImpG